MDRIRRAAKRSALYEAPDSENEALCIADTIENRLARNPKERVAILYRTNSQSRQIEEALRRYGRKYMVVGGFSFYQRAEVKDILAYLKVLVSPHDSISLLRIINTPARGIGTHHSGTDRTVRAAARACRCGPRLKQMLEAAPVSGTRRSCAGGVPSHDDRSWRDSVDDAPGVRHPARRVGAHRVSQMLEEEAPKKRAPGSPIWTNLLNAAVDAGERGESMRDFLDHAALVSDADSADERATVSLLTMHNAKGLEFPVVFIAGLEEGLFPHSRSLDSESAMEEERRLCYVGMTRARNQTVS